MYRLFSSLTIIQLFLSANLSSASAQAPVPGGKPIDLKTASSVEELFVLKGHTGQVVSVAFGRDSKMVLSGSSLDKTTRFWDVASGRQIVSLQNATPIFSVSFSPDCKKFLAVGGDFLSKRPGAMVRDVATCKPIGELQTFGLVSLSRAAFSPNGKYVIGIGRNVLPRKDSLALWDASTGRLLVDLGPRLERYLNINGSVTSINDELLACVAFSPDSRKFVTGSTGFVGPGFLGRVKVWDTETTQLLIDHRVPDVYPLCIAFASDGRFVVGGEGKVVVGQPVDPKKPSPGWLKTYDAAGKEALTWKGHAGKVHGVAFSPDGKLIVSAGDDGTLILWNSATGEEVATLKGHTAPPSNNPRYAPPPSVNCVAVSPDGTKIASGGADSTVRVWGVPAGAVPKARN